MKINKVHLKNFMSHIKSTFDIPESGMVLITGENGAGKSSLCEAVAWAGWGKTLRGHAPKGCEVKLETDLVKTHRKRTKTGSARLQWKKQEGETPEYDSTKKTQEALSHVIGQFNVWQKTSVFSSSDACHFTLATDSERKKLLESLLGLGRFDEALKACRAEVKELATQLAGEERTHASLVASIASSNRSLLEASNSLNSSSMVRMSEEEKEELQYLRTKIKAEKQLFTELKEREMQLRTQHGEATTRLSLKEGSLEDLGGDECPTCEQPWPTLEARKLSRDILDNEIVALRDAASIVYIDLKHIAVEIADLKESLEEVKERGTGLKRKADIEASQDDLLANLVQLRDEALDELEDLDGEFIESLALMEDTRRQLDEKKAVAEVLGLKGVRAHMLDEALSGVELLANQYLERLPARGRILQVEIRSATEKKTGGLKDEITIKLKGAGGDDGYKGASGGERRRIDVALLLALMEVASGVHGVELGTLFFDEVFDSLDKNGVSDVIRILEELSEERAIVIISHSEDLIKELPARKHYHVEEGQIRTI